MNPRKRASRFAAFALLVSLATSGAAMANTGHWRTIGVAAMTSTAGSCSGSPAPMGEDDGVALAWIACSAVDACASPTDLHFEVADFATVSDATLSFDAYGASNVDSEVRISCLGPGGTEAAQIRPPTLFGTAATTAHWNVPPACFQQSDVVVRLSRTGSACIAADFVKLNVKSRHRNVPLVEVSSAAGTCGPECAQGMTEDDAKVLRWIACSPAYAYDTPTDFSFDTFDFADVNDAQLLLDTTASGPDARATVTCIDDLGTTLATVVPERLFSQAGEVVTWPVPAVCFVDARTTFRVARTGSNCIGVDAVRLEVDSAARVHPLVANAPGGTCGTSPTEGCLADLIRDDDRILEWVACSPAYRYANPTDLHFSTPEWQTTIAGSFVMDTTTSGADARIRIACVDDAGSELAEILPTTLFPMHERSYAFDVPPACFASDRTRIRLDRVGSSCLGIDFVELASVSGVSDGFTPNPSALEGYADSESVARGSDITFYVHAPEGSFTVEIVRIGALEEIVHAETDVAGSAQPIRADAWKQGAGWSASYVFSVPASAEPGLYAARLHDASSEFPVPFVVRHDRPASAPRLAVLASSNTWAAYNAWDGIAGGGKSFYGYLPRDLSWRTVARIVSTQRPNPAANPGTSDPADPYRQSHLVGGERWILEWLEDHGHDYSMLAAADLEDRDLLHHFHTLLINTHSEYWTPNMFEGLTRFLDAGGHVLYLSGNGLYWRTTRSSSQLETQKDGSAHAHDGEPGGLWRDVGPGEHSLIGVGYTGAGYCTSAPYGVLEPDHWLFDGTGVVLNQAIGADSHGDSCPGELIGASGWETDKVGPGTPANHVLLAQGLQGAGVGSDMVYYERVGGGSVLSAGSINFGRSLVLDPVLTRLVDNALGRMQSIRRDVPLASVAAPDGTCDASCEDTLRVADGGILQWTSCSGVYAYGNPTDFHFDVEEFADVQSAALTLTTTASGPDADMAIRCVDGAGQTLATLSPAVTFPIGLTSYELAVPATCFAAGPDVTIRFERQGANCLGPDYVALGVSTDLRRSRVGTVAATTSCADPGACTQALREDDGDYLRWLACAPPFNTNTEFGNPTDLHFPVSDAARGGFLVLDAYANAPNSQIEITCHDAAGSLLGTLAAPTDYPVTPTRRRYAVPTGCFAGDDVIVRFERLGSQCLAVDLAELHVTSVPEPTRVTSVALGVAFVVLSARRRARRRPSCSLDGSNRHDHQPPTGSSRGYRHAIRPPDTAGAESSAWPPRASTRSVDPQLGLVAWISPCRLALCSRLLACDESLHVDLAVDIEPDAARSLHPLEGSPRRRRPWHLEGQRSASGNETPSALAGLVPDGDLELDRWRVRVAEYRVSGRSSTSMCVVRASGKATAPPTRSCRRGRLRSLERARRLDFAARIRWATSAIFEAP